MKKLFSLALVLALALTMAVSAFAADLTPSNKEQDVTAGYKAPNEVPGAVVYSVTLAWAPTTNDLAYVGETTTYTWDPETLHYVGNVNSGDEAGWNDGSVGYTVTVTNKSNADVVAKTAATNEYDLTLAKPTEEQTVPSAAVTDSGKIEFNDTVSEGKAQTADFTYTYTKADNAKPVTTVSGNVVIGRITVTITTAD